MVHSRRRISWLLLGVAGSKNEMMNRAQTVLGVLVRRDKFESMYRILRTTYDGMYLRRFLRNG